jgi:hypothetical protein
MKFERLLKSAVISKEKTRDLNLYAVSRPEN